MATHTNLPIYKVAYDLLDVVTNLVKNMQRDFKRSIGEKISADTSTPHNECMRNDLKALLDCDTIAMLDGWMDSNGAHLEMHIAHRVGIKVVEARSIVKPELQRAA